MNFRSYTEELSRSNIVNANTMVQVSNPSAQHYDQTKVTQNTNPEKIAENISKYETAQGNYMKMFHGIK